MRAVPRFIVAVAIGLLFAAPLTAQRATAHVDAQVRIAEVLVLDVDPGETTAVATVDGYHEMGGAVVLTVSANRSWKITADGLLRATRVASAGTVVGEPQPRLWWRVGDTAGRGVQADATSYIEVEGGSDVVASGGPGRDMKVVLDYRWLGDGAMPAPALAYTISPN